MSTHSPPSTTGHGPSSSPFAGTDPTTYSPQDVRHVNRTQASTSADAAGSSFVNTPVVVIKGIKYDGLHPQAHPLGTFMNEVINTDIDFVSRYLAITKLPDGTVAGADHEMEMYLIQFQMKIYSVFAKCVPIYDHGIYLRFDNVRDACEAKQLLEAREFDLRFIDNYDFAVAKSQDTAAINEFEGQIKLVVFLQFGPRGRNQKLPTPVFTANDIVWLSNAIETVMGLYGNIRTNAHFATNTEEMTFAFRLEYFSAEAAQRAVASLEKDPVSGFSENYLWQWSTVEATMWSGVRSSNSPHRRRPRIDDKGRLMDFRHLPQANLPTVKKHPADAHNRVRRERIIDGTDVRTTIMLRNIPNKLDWMTLKALLDQVCFGTYDFVYLRIDFKSGHNVGYAFINFSDASGMIAMLDKVEHRGWVGYRSSKNAEISYATIQGREALVQKFRNSSVMQETPFCRPRLFISYDDAVAAGSARDTGLEWYFPTPDNLSKLQRSMDSARSVGLFPPNGITNMQMNRAMTSTFDRGTPRDILHHSMVCNQGGPPPFDQDIDEYKKRNCEQWYALKHGVSQAGLVPFDHIPLAFVQEFLREHGSPTRCNIVQHPNPGVIGRPAVSAPAVVGYGYGHLYNGPAPGPVAASHPYGNHVAGTGGFRQEYGASYNLTPRQARRGNNAHNGASAFG